MLYFLFRLQREALDVIEILLSVMSSVVIEHVTKCHKSWQLVRCSTNIHDWISRLDLINPFIRLDWISSILIFDLIWLNSVLFFDFIWFLWLNCSYLRLLLEGCERRIQEHYIEYYWLGPELTQNTWGQYIPIFPVGVSMLTPPGHKHYRVIYYWLTFARRFL